MLKDRFFTQRFNKPDLPITLTSIICFSFVAIACINMPSVFLDQFNKWVIIDLIRTVLWLLAGIGLLRRSSWGWWLASILLMLSISGMVCSDIINILIRHYATLGGSRMVEAPPYYMFNNPWLYLYVLSLILLLLHLTRQRIIPRPITLTKSLVVLFLVFFIITGFTTIYSVCKLSPNLW